MKAHLRKRVCLLALVCTALLFVGGCNEAVMRRYYDNYSLVQSKVETIAQSISNMEEGSDETINLLRVLQTTNAASSPFNPYALPIGAGLTGLIALLESLRRVEKGRRKYAEHELNNNNKKENNGN